MKTENIEIKIDEEFLMQLGSVRQEYQNSPVFFNSIQNKVFETPKAEKLHYNWADKVTITQEKEPAFRFYAESIKVMSETEFGFHDLYKNVLSRILYGWVLSERSELLGVIKNELNSEQERVIEKITELTPVIDENALLNELVDCMLRSIKNHTVKLPSRTAINSYFKSSKTQNMFDHSDINAEYIDYYDTDSKHLIPVEDSKVLGSIVFDCSSRETVTDVKRIVENPAYLSGDPETNKLLKKAHEFN